MSYIGNTPTTAAFPFDQFSGTGAATSFTLTYAPASATSILVAISGVMQNPNLYSVIGTTLSFSPAPPAGTNNISVLYLGLPVIGSTSPGNTAFLSSTDLTATAGQTVFASAGSYTPGFVQVYRNGARLGNADFTATNGTTITLASAAAAGDLVTIEYYTLTSLVNALPLTGGTVTGSTTFNTGVNLAVVSGNVGVGTTSPAAPLHVSSSGTEQLRLSGTTATGYTSLNLFGTGYRYAVGVGNASETAVGLANKFYVYDSTSGAARIVVDPSGYVTLPYQPAFSATRTTGDIAVNAVIVGDSVLVNRGGHYNASNGRFTAPVAGVYMFSGYAMGNVGTADVAIAIEFLKNGAGLTPPQVPYSRTPTGAAYSIVSGACCISLLAGDYVTLRNIGGVLLYGVGTGHNGFSGYLLG